MLYHLFELTQAAMSPARAAAQSYRQLLRNPFNPFSHTTLGRGTAAACELLERTTRRYKKPEFRIAETVIDGARARVTEETVWQKPFCRLIHFRTDIGQGTVRPRPRLVIAAPMSGHYATLLRGTVERFLPLFEVYITDWTDARMAPRADGRFDLNDYVDYIIDICHLFKGDLHLLAVCQPSAPALAATAFLEARDDTDAPRSLILMGGPVDTRIKPTMVNELAQKRGTDWFRRNVITTVPWPNPGQGRQVYPGFLQLTGFMTMNLDRHVKAHKDLFLNLVKGDGDSVDKHREFYDEYLAVMDLTAEFYLQTVDTVFVRHCLPRGAFVHRGDKIDFSAIRRVALMTIEGENDDITGVGQCSCTHELCSNLPAHKKAMLVQPQVGHYGIFNGSRFRAEIAPKVAQFIARHDIRDHPVRRALALFTSNVQREQPAPEALPTPPAPSAAVAPQAAAILRKHENVPAIAGPQPSFLGRVGVMGRMGVRPLWRTKRSAATQRSRMAKKKNS